jgi:hypothetical protein
LAPAPLRLQVKILMWLRLLPFYVLSQLFLKSTKVNIRLKLFISLIFSNRKFVDMNKNGVKLLHFVTFLTVYQLWSQSRQSRISLRLRLHQNDAAPCSSGSSSATLLIHAVFSLKFIPYHSLGVSRLSFKPFHYLYLPLSSLQNFLVLLRLPLSLFQNFFLSLFLQSRYLSIYI